MTVGFDPLSPEQSADPFPVLELARREQPVFYAPQFDLWVVTRYDDVLAVLKDHDAFSSAGALLSRKSSLPDAARDVLAEGWPGMPYIIEVDPPLHERIRGLVTRAFTPRRVSEMEPRIEALCSELIDGFADEGRADIVERFAWPLPLSVLGEMLGIPRADLRQLHEWGMDWLLLQQEKPPDELIDHARGLVQMQRYFVDALEEREREPRDDLMSDLVAKREGLTIPEVAGVPLDLVVAGHVTVTRAIGSAIALMFRHPELRERLADVDRAARAAEEILRLESPAQGLFRRTTRSVELGGATLPEGSRVMVHFGSANRDDTVFEAPNDPQPDRENLTKHVAFGKGIHFCIGAPLARLELRIALPMLLERLPGLRLADEAVERESVFFARGYRRLVVEWDA